jgi:hypothetical protein
VEKETKEVTIVIPKMGTKIIKPTKKLGEEEKVFKEIQENFKGADLRNLFSLTKSSFLCHMKLNFVSIFIVMNGRFLNIRLIPCEG